MSASHAAGAFVRADRELVQRGLPLAQVMARLVDDLGLRGRHGQGEEDRIHGVSVLAAIDQGRPGAKQAGCGELHIENQLQVGLLVVGGDPHLGGRAVSAVLGEDIQCDGPERGELPQSRPGTGQSRRAEPSFCLAGHQRQARGDIGAA